MKGKILIVDDEAALRKLLRDLFEDENVVTEADSKAALEKAFALEQPEVVLLDVKLPDGNGLDLLPTIKKRWPETQVIVLTGAPDDDEAVSWAVEATKRGAFNFIRNSSLLSPRPPTALGVVPSADLGRETMPSIWPVRGQISAGFGQRLDPFSGEGVFHSGVDIRTPYGTRVESAGDGIVLEAGFDSGYGNAIVLDHGYGMTTKYGHLSKIFVVVGQEVERGQVIGAVGMTGKTTGPHLHYEVIVNDTPVNPMKYLHE